MESHTETGAFIVDSPADLGEISRQIIGMGIRIVLLRGELGAGKTTLVKALCKELGSGDEISSPTFALINEYRDRTNHPVYHIDLYRIYSTEEVIRIGIQEYMESGAWCFIEWPGLLEPLLAGEKYLSVSLEVLPDDRRRIVILTN